MERDLDTTSHTKVIFDVGGVLLDWNPRHLYRKLFDGDEAAMETFLATVCTPAWNNEHDAGRRFADGVAQLTERFPEHADMIAAYDARWQEMVSGAIGGTVAILRALKARGTPLYALTNFNTEKFALMRRHHDFFDAFDGIVVSAEERCVKPEPEIYRVLLSRYRLDPAACLFIDDKPDNVATARELGMAAITYHSPERLRADLEARRLLAPLAAAH